MCYQAYLNKSHMNNLMNYYRQKNPTMSQTFCETLPTIKEESKTSMIPNTTILCSEESMWDHVFSPLFGDVMFFSVLVICIGFVLYLLTLQYTQRDPSMDNKATTAHLLENYRSRVR